MRTLIKMEGRVLMLNILFPKGKSKQKHSSWSKLCQKNDESIKAQRINSFWNVVNVENRALMCRKVKSHSKCSCINALPCVWASKKIAELNPLSWISISSQDFNILKYFLSRLKEINQLGERAKEQLFYVQWKQTSIDTQRSFHLCIKSKSDVLEKIESDFSEKRGKTFTNIFRNKKVLTASL